MILLPAMPAGAQRTAQASVSDFARCAALTQASMALLHKGEDSYDPVIQAQSYKEGLGLAQQAVAADDSNADAHFALFATMGRIMLVEGAGVNPFNLMRINRELDRTLELNPMHSDALGAKGGLYRQLPTLLGGSLAKAERYLQAAIASDPMAVGARIELARTYQDMGKAAQAIEPLETAMTIAEQQGKTRQLDEARQLLASIHQAR